MEINCTKLKKLRAKPDSDSRLYIENAECETAFKESPEHKHYEIKPENDLFGRGLLYFDKWWKFRDVDVSVSGELLSGVPAFIEKNTLRIINDEYSYFVPLEKVSYIRTKDAL